MRVTSSDLSELTTEVQDALLVVGVRSPTLEVRAAVLRMLTELCHEPTQLVQPNLLDRSIDILPDREAKLWRAALGWEDLDSNQGAF